MAGCAPQNAVEPPVYQVQGGEWNAYFPGSEKITVPQYYQAFAERGFSLDPSFFETFLPARCATPFSRYGKPWLMATKMLKKSWKILIFQTSNNSLICK
ncbi:hypothetical protein BV898_14069 [Hypsibius exemplaris]|uniref:Uncharacterized protein n=1 Tax=Hypsibius exemplaris TaxID=2072580 RepID=A0A1W0W8X0_HYPEX|nr:hypothetical protein BV898_14069 [Hypsibius exemplaris]